MESYIFALMFLLFGILFIWYSSNKGFYEKTAFALGVEAAKRELRIVRWCGYFLLIGAGVFGVFIMLGI